MPYSPDAGDGVIVNGYSEEWLKKGFPWVYRDEVVGRTGSLIAGRVVAIRDRQGQVLGTGIWDDQGRVEVRRFRHDQGLIDVRFLEQRLKSALASRKIPPRTTAWRWVHAENDRLPGIRVDVWGDHLGISLDSSSLMGLVEPLTTALVELREVEAMWLSIRGVDGESGHKQRVGQIWGAAHPGRVEVMERGARAIAYLDEGHDTGLFCDMREVRSWLEPHWKGARVLNTFAHTGMFSVCAALHGAREVTSVDLSEKYLERARTNFLLNSVSLEPHAFVAEDCFKVLDRLRRKNEEFDIVIADPPSFSHGPEGDWSGKLGLPKLVRACASVVRDGGWIVVASNHGKVTPKDFHRGIQQGARKAGRRMRIVHQGSPPNDFPACLDFPESRYLKVWVLSVEHEG